MSPILHPYLTLRVYCVLRPVVCSMLVGKICMPVLALAHRVVYNLKVLDLPIFCARNLGVLVIGAQATT